MLWNFNRLFAKRRLAAGPASVRRRRRRVRPRPIRFQTTPIRATPRRVEAQARALLSLLQKQDYGTENWIRTPELRQIHLELCEGLGWHPCKWNPLARELTRIPAARKVYARFLNADGRTTKQRIYPIPPRSEVALVDGAAGAPACGGSSRGRRERRPIAQHELQETFAMDENPSPRAACERVFGDHALALRAAASPCCRPPASRRCGPASTAGPARPARPWLHDGSQMPRGGHPVRDGPQLG